MLVMVATNETQGALPGDYAFTVEGELVTPVATQCDNPTCGCERGFPGLASSRATTTAMVVDRPWISPGDLVDAVADYLDRGWRDLLEQMARCQEEQGLEPDDPDIVLAEMVDEHVDHITRLCTFFGPGTIVARHRNEVIERVVPRAA
jgi:hypothetical protein